MAEATLHGVCELIERHAQRLAELEIDNPGKVGSRRFWFVDEATLPEAPRRIVGKYRCGGMSVRLLDMTSDIAVPTFYVRVFDDPFSGSPSTTSDGFACHPDPEVALTMALLEAAQTRCSRRRWAEQPITAATFGSLLWHSARNRATPHAATPDEPVSRSYPSGGAAYSLELYPVLSGAAVESIPAGIHRYRPEEHALEPVESQEEAREAIHDAAARSAGCAPPPVVLVITSRFARQAAYGTLAYSLILKEVGGLFQTLYLVAEHLGLAACALGAGTPDAAFAHATGTNEHTEPIVGEFMIGPRA